MLLTNLSTSKRCLGGIIKFVSVLSRDVQINSSSFAPKQFNLFMDNSYKKGSSHLFTTYSATTLDWLNS